MHEVTVPEQDQPGDDPLDEAQSALAAAVLEILRYVQDEPLPLPRCFALVATGRMLTEQPAFSQLLDESTIEAARSDARHVTAIEIQAAEEKDPIDALSSLGWPADIAGAAIVADLAGDTWMSGPSAPGAAEKIGDGALRTVTAVLTDGTTWSAVRGDDRDDVLMGPSLLPDITDALGTSLESADPA